MSCSVSALRDEYQRLFATCRIREERLPAIDKIVQRLKANQAKYAALETLLGVPWYFVGAIHQMEGDGDFSTHLHNGDPLTARTVHHPAGRPPEGSPPFAWQDSAVDALKYLGLDKWRDWSLAGVLYKWEAYNGFGYRHNHPDVLSPYLWSFSQHYTRGKYVGDHQFSATAVSKQAGTAVILRRMVDQGLVAFPGVAVSAPPPAPPAEPEAANTYEVQKGDTLWAIAKHLGVPLQDLIDANPDLCDPDLIFPGQELVIPGAEAPPLPLPAGPGPAPAPPAEAAALYIVRSGDTLKDLADHFGITLEDLLNLNPQLIYPGLGLKVPVVETPGPSVHAAAVLDGEPLWYKIAKRELLTGIEEIPGPKDNPRIVQYHQATTLKATDDETPWCSSFVNWCLEQAGIKGTRDARAISWRDWGRELDEPRHGCIAVFPHHVGFYAEDNGDYIRVLGGNQSDAVTISNYAGDAVLTYRWPLKA
jgi:uncharacterized protein (TIGR02594 family)